MAANCGVLGRHGLQRSSPQVAGEDDVDDVLGGSAVRRDRFDDGDRALERQVLFDPALLGELAFQRLKQSLPAIDAASGKHPVLLARLLLADKEDAALAPEDGRNPDSRFHHTACDEPKPRTPRSLPGSSSTSRTATSGTGRTTSWAILSPGSATNVLSRSVFRSTTL